MIGPDYDQSVFINCPFDDAYRPIFEAIAFAISDLGFRPRSARERVDSGEVRLSKIVELIAGSRYSVHDLSRTEPDVTTSLPRFNMPLELGIDLGCRYFSAERANKTMLIFDTERYRYQKYISDIAGHDIQQHNDSPEKAIVAIRHWLRTASGLPLRAAMETQVRYEQFRGDLTVICGELHLDVNDLTFTDLSFTIATWLREKGRPQA